MDCATLTAKQSQESGNAKYEVACAVIFFDPSKENIIAVVSVLGPCCILRVSSVTSVTGRNLFFEIFMHFLNDR